MKLLTSYSDWAMAFECFSKGDDTILEIMSSSRFDVDAGTGVRFYKRLEQAYNARKCKWVDSFNKSLQWQKTRSLEEYGIIIRNANLNLQPLHRFIAIPLWHTDVAGTLKKDLENFITDTRQNMKKSISSTAPYREQMLIILNNFGICHALNSTNSSIIYNQHSATENTAGRKIIF